MFLHTGRTSQTVRLWVILLAGMLAAVLWPMIASGADGADESEGNGAAAASLNISMERVGRADVDDTDASFGFTEYAASLSWQFLLLDLDHRRSDWRSGSELGSASRREPWGELTRIAPGLQYYGELDDRWGLWLQMSAIAGFEDDVSSRSWTLNPQVVGLYMPRDDLNVFAGMGSLYHPVDSTLYPVLGVTWNRGTQDGFSGTLGLPETTLRYHFNERLAVKADVQRDIRTYRLSDGNPTAPSGYLHTDEVTPGIHLEYFPAEALQVTMGVRRFMGRSITIYSREERRLADHDVDDAWSFRLEMEYGF
ncbi:hypothetical protein [Marinobacter sp.]|uniref:hypothetical protein n=1 Tax=Marinobacter sp. TaxID=50741 RepID=UPI0035641806